MVAPSSDWRQAVRSALEGHEMIVASPDVDGILSAAIVAASTGARLIGIYTTTDLLLFDGHSEEDALSALWVDHDIDDSRITSIGQHLLSFFPRELDAVRGARSFNPNEWYQQVFQQSFRAGGATRDKYPFGTAHLLASALGMPTPSMGSDAFGLFAHADGSWVNATRYEFNCRWWASNMFDSDGLVSSLTNGYVQSPANRRIHGQVVAALAAAGVETASSQGSARAVPDGWDDLVGSQKLRVKPGSYRGNLPAMNARYLPAFVTLVNTISRLSGLVLVPPSTVSHVVRGEFQRRYPNELERSGLAPLIAEPRLFSHAIVLQRQLNYTLGVLKYSQ